MIDLDMLLLLLFVDTYYTIFKLHRVTSHVKSSACQEDFVTIITDESERQTRMNDVTRRRRTSSDCRTDEIEFIAKNIGTCVVKTLFIDLLIERNLIVVRR